MECHIKFRLLYYFSTEILTMAHARKICTELLVYIFRSACDRSVLWFSEHENMRVHHVAWQ